MAGSNPRERRRRAKNVITRENKSKLMNVGLQRRLYPRVEVRVRTYVIIRAHINTYTHTYTQRIRKKMKKKKEN